MTMRCRNGQEHTHDTVAQSRACWLGGQAPAAATLAQPESMDTPSDGANRMAKTLMDNLATLATARVARGLATPATEGMYRKAGQIYKVQRAVHGSGRLYAKRLDVATSTFVRAEGMVSKLTSADRMTQEEAKAFGQLYGMCVRCLATLTDEASIAAGIGPICATKI